MRLRLELVNPPHVTIGEYSVDNVVKLSLTIKELADKIKALQGDLRPYELGFIERFEGDASAPLKIQGIDFLINSKPGKPSYAWTNEDRKKVEAGTYAIKEVPTSRGAWKCEPVTVPENEDLVVETEKVSA